MLVLACLAASSRAAMAQFVDVATDNELFAAYCIGALQAGAPTASERSKIEGFRTYLAARGAFTISRSRMASQGLNVAVERGHADGLACDRLRESCTRRCVNAARSAKEPPATCSDTCEVSRCAQPDRCITAAPLPF